jgi:hypothetical protein
LPASRSTKKSKNDYVSFTYLIFYIIFDQ